MLKNVATKIDLFAFDATGVAKTGDQANITAYVRKDGGAVAALTDTSASEVDATWAPGWYSFDVTAAECNGEELLFTAVSTTSGVQIVGRPLATKDPSDFGITAQGTAVAVGAGTITIAQSFGTDSLYGATVMGFGSVQGYWQANFIESNTNVANSVCTLADNWDVTPTGTVTYKIFGSAAPSDAHPAPVNLVQIAGQTASAAGGVIFPTGTLVKTTDLSGLTATVDAATIRTAVGMGAANLDTQLTGIATQTAKLGVGTAQVDVRKINATTVTGNGSSTPWGPA